jgi:murein DD-endopeptidase MepM/ murein hydrolase activator NlpD
MHRISPRVPRFLTGIIAAGTLGTVTFAAPALALLPTGAAADPATSVVAPGDEAVWPLDPEPAVLSGFDPPRTPWGPGHRGVDLAAAVGQPVRAARAGTVSFAGRLAGRGVVVVDHGDTRTTYEPVTAEVHVGDRLEAGARLGRLELFGSHCFPRACLHWGLLDGERYLDPLTLVGAGPVRLLPWEGVLSAGNDAPAPQVVPPGWTPVGAGPLFRG